MYHYSLNILHYISEWIEINSFAFKILFEIKWGIAQAKISIINSWYSYVRYI